MEASRAFRLSGCARAARTSGCFEDVTVQVTVFTCILLPGKSQILLHFEARVVYEAEVLIPEHAAQMHPTNI